MRSAVSLVLLATIVSIGCQRRSEKPVSRTEITAAPIASEDFNSFRESAYGDIANVDQRIDILERRAATRDAPEARALLADARERRDALSRELDGLRADTWGPRREGIDRTWEEINVLVERAGDLLADEPR